MERSTVSMRVAFVLRSAEVQLLFRRFVRDLSIVIRHETRLVNSPPPQTQPTYNPPNPKYNPQTQLLLILRRIDSGCVQPQKRSP